MYLFFYCFCIFIPQSENKHPTTPLFYVLLYYEVYMQPKKIKITNKYSSPLLGMAPKDPKAQPTMKYLCSQPQSTPENVHFSYSRHRAPLA